MTSELKPCPFCGGEASLFTNIMKSFSVECNNCLMTATINRYSKEQTIKAWNRRAE